MGLERIAAVMQGVHDNYDTDLLRALIAASAEASKTAPDGQHAVAHRVIADHLRAVSFLIADGVLPSNEGRGYVLRRIMRRAMRHAHIMGATEPILWSLVATLVREMGAAFPELVRAEALITETLRIEEARFKETLGRGLKLLDEETGKLGSGEALPGEAAFRLYDTFGFPLDLTEDILRGRGRGVDTEGFEVAMAHQRAQARAAWAGSGETAEAEIWLDIRERLGPTEFLGYSTMVAEGQIVSLVAGGQAVEGAEAGAEVEVLTNQTPFYGESGGQVGDTGAMFSAAGARLAVRATAKRAGDLIVHRAEITDGPITLGDVVELRVDAERRDALRGHHSATHLLHEALRRRLGDHVTQKGSMVAPDRLRFDISHPKAVTAEDLAHIEAEINACIRANSPVVTRLMTRDEAVAEGATALFGEKYGDEVRVVAMGGRADEPFSIELCGGTHVVRTGDIGAFKLVSESALAAGVRRIEAVAGAAAQALAADHEALLRKAAAVLKTAPADLLERIEGLLEDRKRLDRELSEARRQLASGGGAGTGAAAREIAGVKVDLRKLEGVPAKELKSMADDLKKQIGSGVVRHRRHR